MKTRKTVLKYFSIMDYEEEAQFLRNMHKSGWKLVYIGLPGIYHFVKCKPEDVVYQLDYNQEGIDHKSEYVQLFEDCGWEYLFDFVGYSYFRKSQKDMEGEEAIFCDDESRFDMLKRIFRGRMILLIILFFGVLIPEIILLAKHNMISDNRSLFILCCVLFGLYTAIIGKFCVRYVAYKRKLEK